MTTLKRLAVLPDPEWKGKHPYHDHRWIVTEGASFEEPRHPGEWIIRDGMVIAKMTDCPRQPEYARLLAAAPELVEALEAILQLEGETVDANRYGTGDEERRVFGLARAALAKANGA